MAHAGAVTETALPDVFLERSRAGLSSIGALFEGEPNLSLTERTLYVVGGLGLAAAGVTPRPNPLLNVLALAGGVYLAWSGYKGRCPIRATLLDTDSSGTTNARISGPA
jgi:hypothetical protein